MLNLTRVINKYFHSHAEGKKVTFKVTLECFCRHLIVYHSATISWLQKWTRGCLREMVRATFSRWFSPSRLLSTEIFDLELSTCCRLFDGKTAHLNWGTFAFSREKNIAWRAALCKMTFPVTPACIITLVFFVVKLPHCWMASGAKLGLESQEVLLVIKYESHGRDTQASWCQMFRQIHPFLERVQF